MFTKLMIGIRPIIRNELSAHPNIIHRKNKTRFRRRAVPPRTSNFLVISLQGTWKIEMIHKTDVRFINAHTKRDRRDNDHSRFCEETLLVFKPHFGRQTRMIWQSIIPLLPQDFGIFLCVLSGQAIDNAALPALRLHPCE